MPPATRPLRKSGTPSQCSQLGPMGMKRSPNCCFSSSIDPITGRPSCSRFQVGLCRISSSGTLWSGRRRIGIHDIDVIRKADGLGRAVVKHDVEVLGIHQAADDGMQRAHHLGHVVFGARLFGDGIQRPLQSLGQGQARNRLVQATGFGQLAQPRVRQAAKPGAATRPAARAGAGPGSRGSERAIPAGLRRGRWPGPGQDCRPSGASEADRLTPKLAEHEFANFHHGGCVVRVEKLFDRAVRAARSRATTGGGEE